MSTMSAMVTMMMAAMAQVLRAQRVLSIQVEKATSFLGKTYGERKVGGGGGSPRQDMVMGHHGVPSL